MMKPPTGTSPMRHTDRHTDGVLLGDADIEKRSERNFSAKSGTVPDGIAAVIARKCVCPSQRSAQSSLPKNAEKSSFFAA